MGASSKTLMKSWSNTRTNRKVFNLVSKLTKIKIKTTFRHSQRMPIFIPSIKWRVEIGCFIINQISGMWFTLQSSKYRD